MDIVEFLRARLDEDERDFVDAPPFIEDVDSVLPGWGRRVCPICDAKGWSGTEMVTEHDWFDHAETVHQRARVLAEVEAKRRIVDALDSADRDGRVTIGGFESCSDSCAEILMIEVAHALALPYVDHPDYDKGWELG